MRQIQDVVSNLGYQSKLSLLHNTKKSPSTPGVQLMQKALLLGIIDDSWGMRVEAHEPLVSELFTELIGLQRKMDIAEGLIPKEKKEIIARYYPAIKNKTLLLEEL